MIFRLFRKNKVDAAIVERQYAALTSAARQTGFYRRANVPDTVMGRFEMLSLVLILYFRRSAKASPPVQAIAQEIVDAFFEDLDHSMRELGIGDQGVPKRMKKLASMFYGRVESYGTALGAGDRDALAAALLRNFHPEGGGKALSMAVLADYMIGAAQALDAVEDDVLARGMAEILQMEDGDAV